MVLNTVEWLPEDNGLEFENLRCYNGNITS